MGCPSRIVLEKIVPSHFRRVKWCILRFFILPDLNLREFFFLFTSAHREEQMQAQDALSSAFFFQIACPGFEQVIERDHANQLLWIVPFYHWEPCKAGSGHAIHYCA